MSAGNFVTTKYKTDKGIVMRMRVQPETLQASDGATVNSATTDALTPDLPSAKARGSSRSFGVIARNVTVKWSVLPDGYEGDTTTIPILQKSVFDSWQFDATVSYLGGSGTIVGKKNESIR